MGSKRTLPALAAGLGTVSKIASASDCNRRCGRCLQRVPIRTSSGLHVVFVGTQRPPESRRSAPHATVITLEMIVSLALLLQPTLSAKEPNVLSWNVSLIGSCDWADSALNVQLGEPAKEALRSAPAATLPALGCTHGTAAGVEGVAVDGVAVEGVAVDGVAVDGVAVDGVAVEGVAVDGVAVDGTAVDGVAVVGVGEGVVDVGAGVGVSVGEGVGVDVGARVGGVGVPVVEALVGAGVGVAVCVTRSTSKVLEGLPW
jgi:hypothetical protein